MSSPLWSYNTHGYNQTQLILDEKLNNRIISGNFNVMPTIEQDNILQLWVWGLVFGYIHFDPETNFYWIRSKSRRDAIHKYRFNLNKQRDVAFDIFKTEGLYHEIEDLLNTEISRHGNEAINQKIQQIKDIAIMMRNVRRYKCKK